MIKFFSKIRKQLLTENRFSKYLLYAIGEIILVVIGILIALQVNNWNELKKNNATVKLIFEDILNDLEYDIQLADKEINYYNGIDSLCRRVLTNKVSIKDYDEGLLLMYPYIRFLSDDLSMNAADLLLQKSEIIPVQYKDEFNLIKEIYNNDIEDIIYYNHQLEKYLIDLQYEYRKNYDWFSGSKEEHLAQKKFFRLNNPKYFNNVALFEKKVEILNASYNVFRTNAIIAYHQIHKKNNSLRKIPDYIPSFLKASHEELTEYVGSYSFSNKSILKFTIENFYLKMEMKGNDNQNIYKISKDIFVPGFGKNDRIEFKRDSTGVVVSFDVFENRQLLLIAKRIKD